MCLSDQNFPFRLDRESFCPKEIALHAKVLSLKVFPFCKLNENSVQNLCLLTLGELFETDKRKHSVYLLYKDRLQCQQKKIYF